MTDNRKPLKIDPETHEKLKKLSDDAQVSMGGLIKSFVNMVENRVAYEKKHGIVPVEHPKVHNPMLDTFGQPKATYSDYGVYVALHLLDIGMISEEEFKDNCDDLPFFVFILGAEVVERVNPDKL